MENTVRCLKILSGLAEDCSSDTLERLQCCNGYVHLSRVKTSCAYYYMCFS